MESGTYVGRLATGINSLVNATAIGANASVTQDNSLVLGSIAGVNLATASTRIGIGTTAPATELDVRSANNDGGLPVQILGRRSRGTPTANAAVISGDRLLSLVGQGFDGSGFLSRTGMMDVEATSGGARIVFRTTADGGSFPFERVVIEHDGRVGIGTTTPAARLHVTGTTRIDTLGTAGSNAVCRNASNEIASCSSSLRYKQDVEPYRDGLALLRRLRPVQFTWKGSGAADVGLGAEDVAGVDPRLVVRNDAGEVEGVKYDRLTVVLASAVRELEGALEDARADRDRLRATLAELEVRLAAFERQPRPPGPSPSTAARPRR